jgi:hypothetical protein
MLAALVERGGAKLRPHWDLTSRDQAQWLPRPHGDLAPRSGAVAVEASQGFGSSFLCTQHLSTSSAVEVTAVSQGFGA